MFIDPAPTDICIVSIIFVMNINPVRSSTPFASVANEGCLGEAEDEVLFSMHSVFRIGEITSMGDNARLIQVQLNLASDKDNDLCQLVDYVREEIGPHLDGWYRLGLVLWQMGETAVAHQAFEILSTQNVEESTKALAYRQIGLIK